MKPETEQKLNFKLDCKGDGCADLHKVLLETVALYVRSSKIEIVDMIAHINVVTK